MKSFLQSSERIEKALTHIQTAPGECLEIKFPFISDYMIGLLPTDLLLVGAKTGAGKCLGKDTPVVMYDGSIKYVQDVKNGELLMGPDSTPRKVEGVTRGYGPLFKVEPIKGMPWVCNGDHILSLKHTSTNEIVNITVNDWLKLTKTQKAKLKQWRANGIDFPAKYLPIDPYIIGVWLGDGSIHDARITIGNHKQPIKDYLKKWANENSLNIHVVKGSGCEDLHFSRLIGERGENLNPFRWIRESFVKSGYKFIINDYLTGSREQRIAILSGLLDTDGNCTHGGYDFTSKSKALSEAVCYLAKSLGLAAYLNKSIKGIKGTGFVGTYYRVSISGDTSFLKCLVNKNPPRMQIKSVLKTGFDIKPIGDGDYYGFTLDKDHLFLLGDFTVTHNTQFLTELALNWSRMGKRVCFIALEAEPEEIEQRILYKVYCNEFRKDPLRDKSAYIEYRRWRLGRLDHIFKKYHSAVVEKTKRLTANIYTHYMTKAEFTVVDMAMMIDEIRTTADVCIVDHLHYFDLLSATSDLTAMKSLMKKIREMNLAAKVPFVMAAHLRKDLQSIMPSVEDFMGSSDIPKIATCAILLAPKPDSYDPVNGIVQTLFSIPKMRGGGQARVIAEIPYSIVNQEYYPTYTLSTVSPKGDKLTPIPLENYPRWSKSTGQKVNLAAPAREFRVPPPVKETREAIEARVQAERVFGPVTVVESINTRPVGAAIKQESLL
jgi:hypothetical protein